MTKKYTEEELQKILHSSTDDLLKRLKQWQADPSSQPEIEYWYNHHYKLGKTLPRPLAQWEKEANIYIPLLDKAMELEKNGNKADALRIYLEILESFEPIGTAYYDRPIMILEREKMFEEVINLYNKAIANPRLIKSKELYQEQLEKLRAKLHK